MSSTTHSNPVVHVGSNWPNRSVPTSHRVMAFWETMIGKKVVMAVTGIVLVGFVIGHMWGNLKMFSGPDEINAYSRFLRDVGMPELAYGQLLWAVRITLLLCVALHITAAYQLTRMSWAARPVAYNVKRDVETTFSGRMMCWGGQLSTKGWRAVEPNLIPLPVERPRAIRKLAEVVLGSSLDLRKVAGKFALTESFLKSLLDACAPAPNTGELTRPKQKAAVLAFSRN